VRSVPASLCALALLAGCGSSSDSETSSTSTTPAVDNDGAAAKFVACFKKPGYRAVKPAAGEESLFALQVARKGYDVVPVNVARPGAPAADAYLVFFNSPANAAKARVEEAVVGETDVQPLVRGAAFAGFTDQSAFATLRGPIERCL
jgi:hypothetical protein